MEKMIQVLCCLWNGTVILLDTREKTVHPFLISLPTDKAFCYLNFYIGQFSYLATSCSIHHCKILWNVNLCNFVYKPDHFRKQILQHFNAHVRNFWHLGLWLCSLCAASTQVEAACRILTMWCYFSQLHTAWLKNRNSYLACYMLTVFCDLGKQNVENACHPNVPLLLQQFLSNGHWSCTSLPLWIIIQLQYTIKI